MGHFFEDCIQQLHFRQLKVCVYINWASYNVTHRSYMNIGNGYLTINQLHLNTSV